MRKCSRVYVPDSTMPDTPVAVVLYVSIWVTGAAYLPVESQRSKHFRTFTQISLSMDFAGGNISTVSDDLFFRSGQINFRFSSAHMNAEFE